MAVIKMTESWIVSKTRLRRPAAPLLVTKSYYTLSESYPVFHITAITHRKDAVYPATIVGIPPMGDFLGPSTRPEHREMKMRTVIPNRR